MNQQPIFLLGAHKSGTSMLRSLFDGHSQLYALPLETHYFQLMQYWVDYEYRKQRPKQMTRDDIIEAFCDWIHHCNSSSDRYADSIAEGIFNEQKFRVRFSNIEDEDTDADRMSTYFEAIHYSVTGKPVDASIRIVEKSIENAEFAVHIQSVFPKAKFIHIVRNPYANIVALRRFKSFRHGFPLMPRLLKSLYNSYYYLYKNKNSIKNYFILRYEDLVSKPLKWMQSICNFVDLSFEDILLTPTYQGNPWGGNSTSGKVFTGIDASNLNKWETDILPVEVFYINQMFPFLLNDYDYELKPVHGSFWSRAKGESLKRYFYNRVYRYYMP